MITVFGEGRGFRVVWLLEEMGLAYRLRPVDLMAGAENDPEFMAINPGGFIPAIRDGEVTMVESIAIMDYPARSRLPRLPAVPSPGRSRSRGLHLFRRRRPPVRARGRAGQLERPPGAGRVRDPAEAGDAPVGARALHGRRDVHRGGHFGDLRPATGAKKRRRHPRRGGNGLHGPRHRSRRLPARPSDLRGHAGVARLGAVIAAPARPPPPRSGCWRNPGSSSPAAGAPSPARSGPWRR